MDKVSYRTQRRKTRGEERYDVVIAVFAEELVGFEPIPRSL
jgi:hypothetical protein